MPKSFDAARRILVVRHRFIGDTLLAVPFLRALRRARPDARIEALVGPGSGELLEGCPYLDELHWFAPRKDEACARPGVHRSLLAAAWAFRKRRFDAVFVLKRALSAAFFARLTGAPIRVGFNTESGWAFHTHAVPYPERGHEAEAYLALLRAVGVASDDLTPEAWPTDAELAAVDARLAALAPGVRRHIGVHVAAGNLQKRWAVDRFAELLARLDDALGGDVAFHLVGGPGDAAETPELLRRLPTDALRSRVHDWGREGPLRTRQALMFRLELVVGVDSGPLHMAAAAGVPVVAIFGPMSPERWRPLSEGSVVVARDLECRPCDLRAPCLIGVACLVDLPVDAVLDACLSRLGRRATAV